MNMIEKKCGRDILIVSSLFSHWKKIKQKNNENGLNICVAVISRLTDEFQGWLL